MSEDGGFIAIRADEYRALVEDHARFDTLVRFLFSSATMSYGGKMLLISQDELNGILKALFPAMYADALDKREGVDDD